MTKMTHRCEACGRADSELIYLRFDDRYICEKCLEDAACEREGLEEDQDQ